MGIYEIEDVLPCPIKFEVSSLSSAMKETLLDVFEDVLDVLNEGRKEEVDHIYMVWLDPTIEDPRGLDLNEYRLSVGDAEVLRDFVIKDFNSEDLENACRTVAMLVTIKAKEFYDKIIALQKQNQRTLDLLEEERDYEKLCAYYLTRQEQKGLLYLKKLAARYPHSSYARMMIRLYRGGKQGLLGRNSSMYKESDNRRRNNHPRRKMKNL